MTHKLILVAWHIGNRLDVTVNAARAARRIRVFLAEDPALAKRQFETDLGIDCRGKEFLLVKHGPDPRLLKAVLSRLRAEDVGLICSGGIPGFIDPGGWLVRRLRSRQAPISALPGASILSTLLSLSGLEWPGEFSRGTFVIFLDADASGIGIKHFQQSVRRDCEPVFVFLNVPQFQTCLAAMRPVIGKRLVSAFFDLTKTPASKFPYADRVMTMSCVEWLEEAARMHWTTISDVALMVHPRRTPP